MYGRTFVLGHWFCVSHLWPGMFTGPEIIVEDGLPLMVSRGNPAFCFVAIEPQLPECGEISLEFAQCLIGARDGGRTRTARGREILSLLCLPISPPGLLFVDIEQPIRKRESEIRFPFLTGAAEESRTLDLNLGKVALYQLSYCRKSLEARAGVEPTYTDLQSGA